MNQEIIDRTRNKLNSSEFKNFVLFKMEQLQSGSSKHPVIFAGGALASMAIEFLKINTINIAYNDLDFFRFIDQYEIYQINSTFLTNIQKSRTDKNLLLFGTDKLDISFNDIVTDIHFANISHGYGSYSRELVKSHGIRILHTARKELINYVYLTNGKSRRIYNLFNYNLYDLINSFDINATQIGLDLKTNELYFTNDFILFLYTKQLEITRFSTPAHSLIRLFKKAKEMNVFFNLEDSLAIYSLESKIFKHNQNIFNYFYNKEINMFPDSGNKDELSNDLDHLTKNFSNISTNLFFGKEHFEKALKSDLNQYVNIKNKVNQNDFTNNELEFCVASDVKYKHLHFLDLKDEDYYFNLAIESLKDVNFFKYDKDNSFYKYTDNQISDLSSYLSKNESDYKNERYLHNTLKYFSNFTCGFKLFRNQLNSIRKTKYFDFKNNLQSGSYFDLNLDHNFNSINTNNNLKLINLLKNHHEIEPYIFTKDINCSYLIYKLFKNLEKIFGELFYPLIPESTKILNSFNYLNENNFEEYFNSIVKEINFLIEQNQSLFKDESELFKFENNQFSIIELNSSLELKEEGIKNKNCVGGYSYRVKDKGMIILSVRYPNKKRLTISLEKISIKKTKKENLIFKPKFKNFDRIAVDDFVKNNYTDLINSYEFEQIKAYRNEPALLNEHLDALIEIAKHFNIYYNLDELNNIVNNKSNYVDLSNPYSNPNLSSEKYFLNTPININGYFDKNSILSDESLLLFKGDTVEELEFINDNTIRTKDQGSIAIIDTNNVHYEDGEMPF